MEIQIPLSGHRKDLVDHARLNADEALSRHLATRESQDKIRLRLQQWMGIDSPLERIEVYDNSHLQGTDAYGTMVVVGPEGFQKAAYRKFALPVSGGAPAGGDDYDMMRTVMRRRFRLGAEAPNLPDLIMLDGGKGHLNAVAEVMKTLGLAHIPLLAIAKGPDRNAGREVLFRLDQPPAHLDLKDPLLYDLQRLRDEAHRFAIQTHRAKRIKNITTSKLDEIPGIGPKRKKMLLQHFGSLAGVQQAGVKDLSAVKGMNAALAQIIYHYYHP